MTNSTNWQHKWFGVRRELEPEYQLCPSITDFLRAEHPANVHAEDTARYLETAQVIAITSRLRVPCVLTGKTFIGSLAYRTDGEWLWPDDLAHYFREHDIQLPQAMLETMKRNGFQPPPVSAEAIANLEWPPIR